MAIIAANAPGVYLLEDDQSQTFPVNVPDGARLLVVSSKKGPVNRPVLINDWNEYKETFGGIVRRDERKGNFSARSAYHMLGTAPTYILNLRSFDNDLDLVGTAELTVNTQNDNKAISTTPYADLFSKNQFWVVDKSKMEDANNSKQLLVFSNLNNKKLSIFVRKSASVPSKLTFDEWYKNLGRTMPDYVNGSDFVKDWYVDIVVFENDFSNASVNQGNAAYGYVFDANGLKKTVIDAGGSEVDGLAELATIAESGFKKVYTGSVIPGFIDATGVVSDVVALINADINSTGLLATLNEHILDSAADWEPVIADSSDPNYYISDNAKKSIPVDFLGHNLCHINAVGAFDETNYAQIDAGDNSEVIQGSYKYTLSKGVIEQTVNEVTSTTDFDFDSVGPHTLHKIGNAMIACTETEDGVGEFDYAIDVSEYAAGSALYLFDSTRASVGEKFVSKDGNLSTVLTTAFVGVKSYLKGFNTIEFPIMAKSTSVFDSGNDAFTNSIDADLSAVDGAIFADDADNYGDGSTATTVGVGSTGTTLVVAASAGLSADMAIAITIDAGGVEYHVIDSVTDGTNVELKSVMVGALTSGNLIYAADIAGVAGTDYISVTGAGDFNIVAVADEAVTEIAGLVITDTVGLYAAGGFLKSFIPIKTDFSFSASDEYEPFPTDTISGLYIYPVGHTLAGQPVVGESVSSKVVMNPDPADLTYVYQLDGNGDDATITYPAAYNQGAAEELVDQDTITIDMIEAYDTAKAATVRAASSKENVYLTTFDKPVAINKHSGPEGILGDTAEQHSATVDPDYHLILDDSTDVVVFNNDLAIYKVIDSQVATDNYNAIPLSAYSARKEQFLDGTASRQISVLDVMLEDSMKRALSNRDLLEFRYIVDAFKSYIEPAMKYQFPIIAESRQTCAALCNLPSMKDMSLSINPYFSKTIGGDFDPTYLAEGGNLQLPYTNTVSLPTKGASHVYFFGSNLLVSDSGETILYPYAAVASNNYARKFQGGKAYDIILGPATGSISEVGVTAPEYIFAQDNFGKGELDTLYPWGYNAVVQKRRIGMYINGERTAQNKIETSLSLAHSREIIIDIQLQMIDLLTPFVGKYNTAQNRLTIKTGADAITSPYVSAGALFSATNQMDTKNNTTDVIEESTGVLDTVLVIGKGMEIVVHRTTIDNANKTISFELL